MKTKDLIRRLQEADPSGEIECCVGNVDILFVSHEPAYYDGRMQVLIRDEKCKYYNVIGAKYVENGYKIQIHAHSIEDALCDHPELPVEFEGGDNPYNRVLKKKVEIWREQMREINDYIDNERDKTEEGRLKHEKRMEELKLAEENVWNDYGK